MWSILKRMPSRFFGKDDVGRETQFFKTLHHLPRVSSPGGDDQVRFERDDPFKIEADVTSHPNLGLGLFRKVAMDGDAYNLLVQTQGE